MGQSRGHPGCLALVPPSAEPKALIGKGRPRGGDAALARGYRNLGLPNPGATEIRGYRNPGVLKSGGAEIRG